MVALSPFAAYTHSHNLTISEGWTPEDSPDEQQLKELGDMMSDDIYAVEGKRYTSQKKIGLYRTSGTASDWLATLLAVTTSLQTESLSKTGIKWRIS